MNEIKVVVQDAIISIEEQAKVEQQVNEIAKKFSNYLPTADTLPADRATRAELRKVTKSLDDKRKEIKKDFNKPLKEFEEWVKKASKPLADAIDAIDKGIKEIEENERLIRLSAIEAAFKSLAEQSRLDHRIFAQNYENYNKAANFTANKKLKKGILDEIAVAVDYELQKQQGRKNDIASISELAFERNLATAPYIRDLDAGKNLNEIISDMLNDASKRDEAQAKREAEQAKRDEEMARKASEFEAQRLQESFNVPEDVTEQATQAINVADEQIPQQQTETLVALEKEPEKEVKKLKVLTLEILIDENNPLTPFRPFLDEHGYVYQPIEYVDYSDHVVLAQKHDRKVLKND